MPYYSIEKITLTHNIIPILFIDNIPDYFYLKYIVLTGKNKSFRTKYLSCRYYKLFHQYFNEVLKIELNTTLKSKNQKEIISNNLLGLTNWLHSIIKSETNFNVALTQIEKFLTWHFYSQGVFNENLSINYNVFFKQQKFKTNNSFNYKTLSKSQVEKVLSFVHPLNPSNCFKENNRIRNYLLFSILIETGIRMSELLLLKIDDFIRSDNRFYIRIHSMKSLSIIDKRINLPRYKNILSQRTISISPNTYVLFEDYLKYSRHKSLNRFVFTSNQNKALSISSVNNIIKNTSVRLNFEFTCHSFRHQFAEAMLSFLIEENGLDMERAKDELRMICGWALNSTMPSYYAKTYISQIANNTNEIRLKKYYE